MKIFVHPVRWLVLVIALVGGLAGCRHSEEDPQPTVPSGQELFVSAQAIITFPKAQAQLLATAVGFGAFAPQLQYDATYYKLVYKTTFKGQQIQVSGLLGVPLNMPKPPGC